MADHVRCYLHAAFAWGMKSEHDYRSASPRRFRIPFNPVANIPTEPKKVGTRWLSEVEFVTLYQWLEHPDAPVHPAYLKAMQFLMLTGQRVQEVARLRVKQWNRAEQIIDWARTKNTLPHAIPLPSLAVELLESLTPRPCGSSSGSALSAAGESIERP